jgi:uncharacterized protein
MRIVAIEEHYTSPGLVESAAEAGYLPDRVISGLRDTGDARLADMDAAGIDVQVLSLAVPGVQNLAGPEGPPLAARLNDELAHRIIAAHPDRFAGFACLPLGDPAAAAAELDRAVTGLGLAGTMISGMIGGRFLDDPAFDPVLAAAARLDVPIYLHPGFPPAAVAEVYYRGFDPAVNQILGSAGYGWHYETSLHALRLVLAGVFDRHPGLKIVLGHLGEGLPFHLPRIQDTLTPVLGDRLALPLGDYFRRNFWVTTAGYFYDGPLRLTRDTFGDDRVLFSVDYPFADNRRATDWFAALDLDPGTRAALAHRNADTLLHLTA